MTATVERLGQITNLVHGFIYFASQATDRFAALGLAGRQQYFAGRGAAMGPVGPEIIEATFYNFDPIVVRAAIPSAWQVATPADVQAARFHAAADVLASACGDVEPAQLERAIALATAMVAGVGDEGKPLAAGNRSITLPEAPMLHLWQLVTIIREWRGDAHVAALAAADVSGIQALVLHAATEQVPAAVLQATRGWSDDDWATAIESLATRGLVEANGSFTDVGRQLRVDIETTTNQASQALVDAVGDERSTELIELLRPIRKGLLASGVFSKPLGGTS